MNATMVTASPKTGTLKITLDNKGQRDMEHKYQNKHKPGYEVHHDYHRRHEKRV
jgi:hypothetical protein